MQGTREERLSNLIQIYYEDNNKQKLYKTSCEGYNKLIKEIMKDLDTKEFETDKLIAKLSERVSESFNEDKLIPILKNTALLNTCIETVEVVNYDKLADSIYQLQQDKDSDALLADIDKCRTTTTTLALTVKEKKEKQ